MRCPGLNSEIRNPQFETLIHLSKLDGLEKKYDRQFKIIFNAIRQLMTPPTSKPKQIGFRPKALKK